MTAPINRLQQCYTGATYDVMRDLGIPPAVLTSGHVVVCHPGDCFLGDQDGVVVIPGTRAKEVIIKAEKAVNAENKVREAILMGEDPQKAYVEFGKF
ncbi:hypothetical protein [Thalassorhabdomicrobium marinisediminis]|uniref:hypothetical protein n=1 Tax=Thalassorhabdomicrobium marinisediminis TaxID=2170577 RepID=UPI00248FD589|nr:hypothetical protein [Thalassorhabdomicrobium marinisediminis]